MIRDTGNPVERSDILKSISAKAYIIPLPGMSKQLDLLHSPLTEEHLLRTVFRYGLTARKHCAILHAM
jgi:hypothetical protein